MYKSLSIYILCVFLQLSFTATSADCAQLTQRDWMITLTDALGWSFGLPDEPLDPDYINILTGNRELLIEAEDAYNQKTDFVSLMSFENFGPYTGEGWLHGGREATEVHLSFNLPISGNYAITARIRQGEHSFSIGEKTARRSAGQLFADVAIGTYQLDAGKQDITVTLPPGGSIDSIRLHAPNFAQIVPKNGWQPDAPLSWEVINVTLAQLMELADIFPVSDQVIAIEAEDHPQPGVRVVSIPHLGKANQGRWLRAGPIETVVKIPLNSVKEGFYQLTIRAIGDPIKVVIGHHQTLTINGKAYLEDHVFPSLYVPKDGSVLHMTLPPGAGVDQITFTKYRINSLMSTPLYGLNQDAPPAAGDLDTLTSLLAAFGTTR